MYVQGRKVELIGKEDFHANQKKKVVKEQSLCSKIFQDVLIEGREA